MNAKNDCILNRLVIIRIPTKKNHIAVPFACKYEWDAQFMITVNSVNLSDVKRCCVVSLWYKRMNVFKPEWQNNKLTQKP